MAPAPRTRVPKGKVVTDTSRKTSEQPLIDVDTAEQPNGDAPRKLSLPEFSENPPLTSFLVRRRSSGNKANLAPVSSNDPDIYEHLKHLGPSNAANRPKSTRINTVKIKPATAAAIPPTIPENARPAQDAPVVAQDSHAPEGGVGQGLLASAGREAKDGVHSVAVGYGTMTPNGDRMSWKSGRSSHRAVDEEPQSPKSTVYDNDTLVVDNGKQREHSKPRSRSVSTIASLRSNDSYSKSPLNKRHTARSGSISENVVDVNGIKKIVLETTSSSDSEGKTLLVTPADGTQDDSKGHSDVESSHAGSKSESKKKRKKRGKKKKGNSGEGSESQPLLGNK